MSAIVRAADDYAGGLSEILTVAKSLKQAGGFLPPHLKNEGEIVAVVLAGRELGIPPMASIRSIKLVKGNVTLDASMQLALMVRAGCKVKWLKDGSDGEAILRLERPGQEPHESRYTLDMARKAGLTGDNWTKHPAAMLRARCVTAAGKAYVPDVLAGVYLPDELPGDEPAPVRNVRGLDDIAKEGKPRAPTAGQNLASESAVRASAEEGRPASEQRQSPTSVRGASAAEAGAMERSVTAQSETLATGQMTTPSSTTTDGELLDAKAWRARYEALCEELMQPPANWIFGQEDEYALPLPPVECPSFGPDGKRLANKRFDDPAVGVGFLRKRAQDSSFDSASPDKRAWTLYLVARHELSKEADA